MNLLHPDQALALGRAACVLPDTIHGQTHWLEVFKNARALAHFEGVVDAHEPAFRRESDMELICWFAFLHDCCRMNDATDPLHGKRAALYANKLRAEGLVRLVPEAFARLSFALEHHSSGFVSGHKLVGICWDADRLDLGRPGVGVRPNSSLMSTASGRAAAEARK